MTGILNEILNAIANAEPGEILMVFVIWTVMLVVFMAIYGAISRNDLRFRIKDLEYENRQLSKRSQEATQELYNAVSSSPEYKKVPLAEGGVVKEPYIPPKVHNEPECVVPKENIFADTYGLSKDRFEMPKASAVAMIICPKCSWKGRVDETISTYGHTICPYCHEEFREFVR